MKLVRDLSVEAPRWQHGAVSIGNFDGVHQGHARIIRELRRRAEAVGGPVVVFTFDPHPVRLLRPDAVPPPLTWTERKAELLEQLGVDWILAYPTDERLLRLTAEEFFDEIICRQLQARAIVEGPNFYFGRNRAGDVDRLRTLCEAREISLTIVEPLQTAGEYVSSSRVRDLIRNGEVGRANEMLTQPYRIRGLVTHGAARGGKIGFPTANVSAVETLLPALGVYAGRAWVDGKAWPAAINLGPNPTFGEQALKVEVHLIGFHGTLYGQLLEVDFLQRLRDIRPFASVEDLKLQLADDVAAARRIATSYPTNDSA